MTENFDLDRLVKDLDAGNVPDWIAEHIRIYRESGGREGHLWDASIAGEGLGLTPTLLLTTVGRKTGQKRTMPLIYGKVGANHIVIGSKGGSQTHPAWYLNLLANPEVNLQVATENFNARARIATGGERAQIWKHMLTVYPPYHDYQAKTSREIPVVVLEKL